MLSIAIILLLSIVNAQSPPQAASVAMAPSAALGESIPVVNIPARIELPKLPVLENTFTLTMSAARIMVSEPFLPNAICICRLPFCGRVGIQLGVRGRAQYAWLQGPGDNSSDADPFILYTGRVYNEALVAGVVRVQQGEFCKRSIS